MKSGFSPAEIRHDIYPARGRKQESSEEVRELLEYTIRHDIYPARGRKHTVC